MALQFEASEWHWGFLIIIFSTLPLIGWIYKQRISFFERVNKKNPLVWESCLVYMSIVKQRLITRVQNGYFKGNILFIDL